MARTWGPGWWATRSMAQAPPLAGIDPRNSGYPVERSQCLTIRVGQATAAECGNLRAVQPLPSVRIFNETVTPTLLYNSEFAHPYPLVPVLITEQSTTTQPDSVEVKVYTGIYGQTLKLQATKAWPGSSWPAGVTTTRRVTATWDALSTAAGRVADTTGYYYYKVEVRNYYGTTPTVPAVTDGKMFIINRSASPYGAGWWLAGHEQLLNLGSTEKVWIGGDGSARFFLNFGGATSYAPIYDRSDSLVLNAGTYTRWTPEGRRVEFNSAGQHVRTINRFGRETNFTYSGSTPGAVLQTISLPTPTGLTYQLGYTGNRLTTVTAPPIGVQTRVTALDDPAGDLLSVKNPGDSLIQFQYLNTAGNGHLLNSRTNRRGVATTFTYDGAKRVATSTVNPGVPAAPIVWSLAHGETVGLAGSAAADTAKIYTTIDGPRSVADSTWIYTNRFGHPRKIVNALRDFTLLRHDDCVGVDADCTWLVFRKTTPVGHVTFFDWDLYELPSRGNLNATRAMRDLSLSQMDTTRYSWDPLFNQITQILPPRRDPTSNPADTAALDTVRFGVSTVNGRRDWQQDRRGISSRINFNYDPTYAEQVTGVVLPATGTLPSATYSYSYDATLRNTATESTPKGFVTSFQNDAVGRTTLIQSPIDSTLSSPRKLQHAIGYSLRGDVIADTSRTLSVTPAETLVVRTFYNLEQSTDSVLRAVFPNPAGLGPMKLSWLRDNVERPIKSIAPDLKYDSTVFDPAGNALKVFNRRYVAGTVDSSQYVAFTYDSVGRMSSRTIRRVQYASRDEGIATFTGQPDYPAYTIPQDSQNFKYRSDGLLIAADNRYAQVRRKYTGRGDLIIDTLRIADVNVSNFTQHVYVSQYRYDPQGRRIAMKAPSQLVAANKDSIRYHFSNWGAMDSVFDLYSNSIAFSYNARGETEQIRYPIANITRRFGFDLDGRIRGDTIANPTQSWPRFTFPLLRANTRAYDGRDKLLSSVNSVAYPETQTASYSGLGYAIASAFRQVGAAGWRSGAFYSSNQTFTTDPLGNVMNTVSTDSTNFGGSKTVTSSSNTTANFRPVTGRDSLLINAFTTRLNTFDAAGNSVFATLSPNSQGAARYDDRASYYDAAGQLIFSDHRVNDNFHPLAAQWRTRTQETSRYDALGRRVWVRAVQDCNDNMVYDSLPLFVDAPSVRCSNDYIRRTVWDGAREFIEIQAPGDTTVAESAFWEQDVGAFNRAKANPIFNDPNPYYGRVVYTNGPDLDAPLTVARFDYADNPYNGAWQAWPPFVILPFWDPAGRPSIGVYSDGAAVRQLTANGGPCGIENSPNRCVALTWPSTWKAYDPRSDVPMTSWMGTLLEDKRDFSGTYFRRNRTYDSRSGRFTQEDPIGLAGGMNLYGFASGDPVNFRDPFGLCPIEKDGIPCALTWGAAGTAGGAIGGGVVGGVTGTFVIPGLGTAVGGGGGAELGALVGGFLGSTLGAARDAVSGLQVLLNTRSGDLPARGKPNTSAAKDDGKGNGQIRDYGPDGRAKTDYDFGHDHGAGDPHAHDWDWAKKPERQPGRGIRPGETHP